MLEVLEKVSVGLWNRRKITGAICALVMVTSMCFILPENAKAQPPIRNPTWTSADLGNHVASLDMASYLSSDNEMYIAVGTYNDDLHLFRASGSGVPEWSVPLDVAGGYKTYMADSVSISPHPYIAVGHGHNVALYDINGNEVWDEVCNSGYYPVSGTAINDDATYVAAGGGNTICLFDATDGTLLSTASTNATEERVGIVDMSQDGRYIAVSTPNPWNPGNVSVFYNNNDVLELVMHSSMTDDYVVLDMSDDGDYIVAGEDDPHNQGGSDARLYHWGDDNAWDWSDGDNYLTHARGNDVYAVAITHQGSWSSVGGTWGGGGQTGNGIMLDESFQEVQDWETSVNYATAVVDHPIVEYAVFGQAYAPNHRTVYFCNRTNPANECYWRYPSNAGIYDVDAEGYFHVVAGNAAGIVHYWRNNPPPVAEFSWTPPQPLEGQDIQFTDESYDPDGVIVSWDWDFGGQGSSTDQNPVFAFGHAGTYPVNLTVTDNEGATGNVTHNIVVTNVAPDVEMTATPTSVLEGENVTFDGFFDDPSWLDTHTANWYFGDGNSMPGTFSPGQGYPHHDMDAVTHAYGRCGDYTARLEVEDDLGAVGEDSVVINVSNVNPSVTLFPPDPIDPDEGDTVTFDGYFDDPSWLDEHTAEWDFGDGQTASGSFQPGVGYPHHEMDEIEHVYGHGGDYIVSLTIWDDCGGIGNASMEISVNNVAPSVSIWAIPPTADEGEDITFDGYFDDPSWLDNHTATWDFGDGSPTEPGTFSPGWGYTHHQMDEVTHAYGKAGVYQVTLTVQDDMGGIGTAGINVTVVNVAPTVTAAINTTNIQEGLPFIVNGTFYDPSWNDTFDEVYFDFGYEDTIRGLGPIQDRGYWPPPGPGNVTHEVDPMDWIYGDDGNYTIYLNVTDEFGGSDSDSVYINVYNVAPTVINITVILHQNAPRTHGYWKHQCKVKNPKQDHPGIRQEWIDAIRSQSMVFTDITTKDDVCNYLDPDTPMTPMKRAKMQLMALWLNVVSGLLWIDSPLHHPGAPGDNSVADFIAHAEWLILTNPTDPNLNWVATIACDINEDADSQNDWSYVDPVVGEYIAHAIDPGTDDLMFVWEDGQAITGKVIHYQYNDGVGPEPDYDPVLNEVKTPWGIYPFVVVDRFIVGYPPDSASGVTAELLCLKDDDGGQSPQANKDCSDPWGSGMMAMGFGSDASVNWTFEFDIDYRSISGGFIIAEVEVIVVNHHPLAEPIIVGGRIEE